MVLIFIALMNMLSKPRRFGPLLSAENAESVKVQTVPKNTKSTSWATTVWINWTKYHKCEAD